MLNYVAEGFELICGLQIKLALPLSSGAEGIGPWRYYYESQGAAEKIGNITTNYGYWSDRELWKFDNVTGNSPRVPFDEHELVALVAPVRLCFLWSVAHIIDIFVVACDTLGRRPGGLVGQYTACFVASIPLIDQMFARLTRKAPSVSCTALRRSSSTGSVLVRTSASTSAIPPTISTVASPHSMPPSRFHVWVTS